jgi:O-methyltransferase
VSSSAKEMYVAAEIAPLLYLDLLKGCLTRTLFPESCRSTTGSTARAHAAAVLSRLRRKGAGPTALEVRTEGRDWPREGDTMIGLARLNNLQQCVTAVLRDGIPGDLIETGVWRGGACIFMRAILKAFGDPDRVVWVADSFHGLPKPDRRYPQDHSDSLWTHSDVLGVSVDEVKNNFTRYGLLDDRVRFLKGWFRDTLPNAPIERIAVLRLDGDMYGSTMDALQSLYPKLSSGGYVIVDDFGAMATCRQAVEDYRRAHGICEAIEGIDWTGVFWRKA